MVTELVILRLEPGNGPRFEAAFEGVAWLLIAADGYLWHRLTSTLDDADVYVLQVEWRDLAAHVEGFEPSREHGRFMAALEPLLAAEPIVVHVSAEARSRQPPR